MRFERRIALFSLCEVCEVRGLPPRRSLDPFGHPTGFSRGGVLVLWMQVRSLEGSRRPRSFYRPFSSWAQDRSRVREVLSAWRPRRGVHQTTSLARF
jgi:hypothetical protein